MFLRTQGYMATEVPWAGNGAGEGWIEREKGGKMRDERGCLVRVTIWIYC